MGFGVFVSAWEKLANTRRIHPGNGDCPPCLGQVFPIKLQYHSFIGHCQRIVSIVATLGHRPVEAVLTNPH